jgi:acetoin utilization protein AcuA
MGPSTFQTDQGVVNICTGLPPDGTDGLAFGLDTTDPVYQPIYTRKRNLAQIAAAGGSLSMALLRKKKIIGYAAIAPPSLNTRWARSDALPLLELKAVEVAWQFRHQGIARSLLTHLFSDAALEDHIVFLSAYAWLWDIAHTGLSCHAYRNMLMTLYAGFGFKSFQTNEPNVCLKPENIFMARIGKHISSKDLDLFKWLRFGITPPDSNAFSGVKTVENSAKNR